MSCALIETVGPQRMLTLSSSSAHAPPLAPLPACSTTSVEKELHRKREYLVYAPLTLQQRQYYDAIVQGDIRRFLLNKARDGDGPAGLDGDASVDASDGAPKAAAPVDAEQAVHSPTRMPASRAAHAITRVG